MNRLKLIAQFLEKRFPNSPEHYHNVWRRRFNRHEEWQFGDYLTRGILQKLDPDYYPKDLDTYFPNHKPSIIQIERLDK